MYTGEETFFMLKLCLLVPFIKGVHYLYQVLETVLYRNVVKHFLISFLYIVLVAAFGITQYL